MILIERQKWDFHKVDKYIYFDDDIIGSLDDIKIIGSYNIELINNYTKLTSLYVQEEYRNKGYFNVFMNDILSLIKEDIYIIVRKESFIKDKYIKYGFEYHSEYDDNFDWYVLEQTPKK